MVVEKDNPNDPNCVVKITVTVDGKETSVVQSNEFPRTRLGWLKRVSSGILLDPEATFDEDVGEAFEGGETAEGHEHHEDCVGSIIESSSLIEMMNSHGVKMLEVTALGEIRYTREIGQDVDFRGFLECCDDQISGLIRHASAHDQAVFVLQDGAWTVFDSEDPKLEEFRADLRGDLTEGKPHVKVLN